MEQQQNQPFIAEEDDEDVDEEEEPTTTEPENMSTQDNGQASANGSSGNGGGDVVGTIASTSTTTAACPSSSSLSVNPETAAGAATSSNAVEPGSIVYPEPGNPYKCISHGVPMSWNEASKQWLPDVEVNEDFLAFYHASYGVNYDYASMPKPEPKREAAATMDDEEDELRAKEPPRKLTKEEKLLKKRETKKRRGEQEMARRQQGWFELDDVRNTSVYASGFPPSSVDEAAFIEFFSKCGVIQKDPRSGKPKVKLYRAETGEPKGDGTCHYVRIESVDLALQILDGWQWDAGHKIHVERARFEQKGDFDPAKKRQRLSAAQKKKFLEKQEKIFEWRPDKPRNYRPVHECTVVLRGMFSLEEIDTKADRIFTLKEDTQKLCEQRFGPVKKIALYDTNPEGVITITFENVEQADAAVLALGGRIVAGRVIQAHHWDGKERFKRAETEEERRRRENAWSDFLGNEEEEEGEEDNESEQKKKKQKQTDGSPEMTGETADEKEEEKKGTAEEDDEAQQPSEVTAEDDVTE